MMRKKQKLVMVLVFMLVGMLVLGACGQKAEEKSVEEKDVLAGYPNRPINVIVPFNPGGGSDLNARVIALFAEKYLGQPIAIINKPGAGGEIGYTYLAKANPDGYTIGYTNLPGALQVPIERDAQYTMDDFEPIFGQVLEPKLLAVSADSPWQTYEDLIEYAKGNPGKLVVANNGPGSHNELVVKGWTMYAGIEANHVPFDGAGPMKIAIFGGHADVMPVGISEIDAQVRPLLQFSEERNELVPDVPTSYEMGLELDLQARRCIQAPKGTPPEIVEYLIEAFRAMYNDPDYIKEMEKSGAIPVFLEPDEVRASIDRETQFYLKFRENL